MQGFCAGTLATVSRSSHVNFSQFSSPQQIWVVPSDPGDHHSSRLHAAGLGTALQQRDLRTLRMTFRASVSSDFFCIAAHSCAEDTMNGMCLWLSPQRTSSK